MNDIAKNILDFSHVPIIQHFRSGESFESQNQSFDFDSFDMYQFWMDSRKIDWKKSMGLGQKVIKNTVAEGGLSLRLLIDIESLFIDENDVKNPFFKTLLWLFLHSAFYSWADVYVSFVYNQKFSKDFKITNLIDVYEIKKSFDLNNENNFSQELKQVELCYIITDSMNLDIWCSKQSANYSFYIYLSSIWEQEGIARGLLFFGTLEYSMFMNQKKVELYKQKRRNHLEVFEWNLLKIDIVFLELICDEDIIPNLQGILNKRLWMK